MVRSDAVVAVVVFAAFAALAGFVALQMGTWDSSKDLRGVESRSARPGGPVEQDGHGESGPKSPRGQGEDPGKRASAAKSLPALSQNESRRLDAAVERALIDDAMSRAAPGGATVISLMGKYSYLRLRMGDEETDCMLGEGTSFLVSLKGGTGVLTTSIEGLSLVFGPSFRLGSVEVPSATILRRGAQRWEAIAAPGAFDAVVGDLVRMVRQGNWADRSNGCCRLRDLGAAGKSAIPALTGALEDQDPRVAECAASALGAMGNESASALSALCRLLKQSASPETRAAAVRALGSIGPLSAEHVDVVRSATLDSVERVRLWAHFALASVGDTKKDHVLEVASSLKSDELRCAAALALRTLGPKARSALPELGAALASATRPYEKGDISRAIREIQGK